MSAGGSEAFWLSTTREVVDRLGWSAPEQLAYLKALGVAGSVDELGLEFDDIWPAVKTRLSTVNEELFRHLEAVHTALDRDTLRWDVESLAHSQEWQEIRELARKVSELLDDESEMKPDT